MHEDHYFQNNIGISKVDFISHFIMEKNVNAFFPKNFENDRMRVVKGVPIRICPSSSSIKSFEEKKNHQNSIQFRDVEKRCMCLEFGIGIAENRHNKIRSNFQRICAHYVSDPKIFVKQRLGSVR